MVNKSRDDRGDDDEENSYEKKIKEMSKELVNQVREHEDINQSNLNQVSSLEHENSKVHGIENQSKLHFDYGVD